MLPSHTFVPMLATPARPIASSWQVHSTWLDCLESSKPLPCSCITTIHRPSSYYSRTLHILINELDSKPQKLAECGKAYQSSLASLAQHLPVLQQTPGTNAKTPQTRCPRSEREKVAVNSVWTLEAVLGRVEPHEDIVFIDDVHSFSSETIPNCELAFAAFKETLDKMPDNLEKHGQEAAMKCAFIYASSDTWLAGLDQEQSKCFDRVKQFLEQKNWSPQNAIGKKTQERYDARMQELCKERRGADREVLAALNDILNIRTSKGAEQLKLVFGHYHDWKWPLPLQNPKDETIETATKEIWVADYPFFEECAGLSQFHHLTCLSYFCDKCTEFLFRD